MDERDLRILQLFSMLTKEQQKGFAELVAVMSNPNALQDVDAHLTRKEEIDHE